MFRATLFALTLPSASAFKFVSQTFKGNSRFDDSSIEIDLDMETVKLRTNSQWTSNAQSTGDTFIMESMILDAEAKRATMDTTTCVSKPMGPNQHGLKEAIIKTCKYFEFPNMPAPQVVAKCLQEMPTEVPRLSSPVVSDGSEEGLQKIQMKMPVPEAAGSAEEVVYTDESFTMKKLIAEVKKLIAEVMKKFQMKVPVPEALGSEEEVVYTDESFIMKKVIAEVKVQGPQMMTDSFIEMIDMNSHAGAPMTMFASRADYGTCTKDAIPPIPAISNPVMKAFLHCMGMGASRASIVV